MNKVGIVVVLYNPEQEIFTRNIPSYAAMGDFLIIVDNTLGGALIPAHIYDYRTIYISDGKNNGIAKALNLGAEEAIKQGCDWLLTMDQDSWFKEEDIKALMDSRHLKNFDDTIIISPVHVDKFSEDAGLIGDFTEAKYVMTSGNLLNLTNYKKLGTFNEGYFIDYVDNEYCFRARLNNFKVLIYRNALLQHTLGNFTKFKIPGYGTLLFSNHSALRKYYLIRNLLYFKKQYLPHFKDDIMHMYKIEIKGIIKMFLFEKGKIKKGKMLLRGISDFRNGITGMYKKI